MEFTITGIDILVIYFIWTFCFFVNLFLMGVYDSIAINKEFNDLNGVHWGKIFLFGPITEILLTLAIIIAIIERIIEFCKR